MSLSLPQYGLPASPMNRSTGMRFARQEDSASDAKAGMNATRNSLPNRRLHYAPTAPSSPKPQSFSGMGVNTPETPVTTKPESSPKRTWRYTALFVGRIELRKILESRRQMALCTKRTTLKVFEIWTAHSNMG